MYKKAILLFDPELRRIGKIIRDGKRWPPSAPAVRECDEVFVQRLRLNPVSLKLSYWKDHFEWKAVSNYPEISGHILDFGCGSGHSDIMLARNGYSVHGIDLSPIGIAIANCLKDQEPQDVKKRLSFELADVTRDAPPTEPFNSVWASHVFEHIPDPGPILEGLRGWVKTGANFLISVPLGHAYDDPSHLHHFKDETELTKLLDPHIDIVRAERALNYSVIRVLCRF